MSCGHVVCNYIGWGWWTCVLPAKGLGVVHLSIQILCFLKFPELEVPTLSVPSSCPTCRNGPNHIGIYIRHLPQISQCRTRKINCWSSPIFQSLFQGNMKRCILIAHWPCIRCISRYLEKCSFELINIVYARQLLIASRKRGEGVGIYYWEGSTIFVWKSLLGKESNYHGSYP